MAEEEGVEEEPPVELPKPPIRPQRPKHPTLAVNIILFCKFCESFCFFGFLGVLVLYLEKILSYPTLNAQQIGEIFVAIAFICTIFGGGISDSLFGKFRTYVTTSWIYVSGFGLMFITGFGPVKPKIVLISIGMILLFLGVSGTTPCLAAFGADQFILPQQSQQLATFFCLYFVAMYCGVCLAAISVLLLHETTACYENPKDLCHPMSFLIPGCILLAITILLVVTNVLRRDRFRVIMPKYNISRRWLRCLWRAFTLRKKATDEVPNWLDRAEQEYGEHFVAKVKNTIKVILVMIVQFVIFWMCFYQKDYVWRLQASQMNNRVGSSSYVVSPETMLVFYPILVLIFAILLAVWSCCSRTRRPLRRIVLGMIFAILAFITTAIVTSVMVVKSKPVPLGEVPPGQAELRIYNPMNCNATLIASNFFNHLYIEPMSVKTVNISLHRGVKTEYTVINCPFSKPERDAFIVFYEKNRFAFYLTDKGMTAFKLESNIGSRKGASVRTLVSDTEYKKNLTYLKIMGKLEKPAKSVSPTDHSFHELDSGTYTIKNAKKRLIQIDRGAFYTILVHMEQGKVLDIKLYKDGDSTNISIFWQLFQFILLSLGEALIFPSALEFMYTQGTLSVKAFMVALWYFTVGGGRGFAVAFAHLIPFVRETTFCGIVAGIIAADMIVFAIVATRYSYVTYPSVM